MADQFVVDPDKAQQMGERLKAAGTSIDGIPPGPQPGGPLGSTGALERAWSEHERSVATARQNLARAVKESGAAFAELVAGANQLDDQLAQDTRNLRTD
jgi:hypothetical protein